MATLTPIDPTTANNSNWTNVSDNVLNDDNTGTYVGNASNNDQTDLIQEFVLDDIIDGDFASMAALSWTIAYQNSGNNADKTWDSLKVSIRNAAGTVVLAGASSTYASRLQTVASNITNTTVQEDGPTGFTYTNTSASESDWNGGIVELAITQTKNKGGNSDEYRVCEVEFTGTYTATGGAATNTVMPALMRIAGGI